MIKMYKLTILPCRATAKFNGACPECLSLIVIYHLGRPLPMSRRRKGDTVLHTTHDSLDHDEEYTEHPPMSMALVVQFLRAKVRNCCCSSAASPERERDLRRSEADAARSGAF